MIDGCGRSIDYVRISITNQCNLRCVYCMPDGGTQPPEHCGILTFDEILRVVRLLTQLGVRHVRITGGEPTTRRGCLRLAHSIHAIPGIETVAMTTNALLLAGAMNQVKEAGISALNISLDTLNPENYQKMSRGGCVRDVLSVIEDALRLGIRVKINAVPVRGFNDGDLTALAALAKDRPIHVRFIELMPVGCGAGLASISSDDVLAMMEGAFGRLQPDERRHGFGPARYVKPEGFVGSIGVISPMSHAFCGECNRIRVTADGYLKLCLNHTAGLDLRALLRSGTTDEEMRHALRTAIARKPERHGFMEDIGDREVRRMNEIGG